MTAKIKAAFLFLGFGLLCGPLHAISYKVVVSTVGQNSAITQTDLTQSTSRLLGRTTAGTGAVEEISVGSGLSLSAGALTATGGSSASGWIFISSGALVSDSTLTISGITQAYTHIKIVLFVRAGTNSGFFRLAFNGDTTDAHYRITNTYSFGGTPGADNNNNRNFAYIVDNTADSSLISIVDLTLFFYTNNDATYYKVNRADYIGSTGTTNAINGSSTVRWDNSGPITSVAFDMGSAGNLLTGTRYYLYGM